jgi:hypothetical protein
VILRYGERIELKELLGGAIAGMKRGLVKKILLVDSRRELRVYELAF